MNTDSNNSTHPAPGSRRTRVWELTASLHCPVIGICIPLGVLRKLVLKWIEGKATLDDFEIHARAVTECGARNPLSESIQRTLDDRHEPVVRAFKAAKTPSALLALWQEALASGELGGALWAALSHPRCNEAIATQIYRDSHMAQHQAGAHARVDQLRLATINDENAVLTRELGRVQNRMTSLVAEKARELQALQSALSQAASERAASEALIESLQRELAQYRETGPALSARLDLQRKLDASLQAQRRLRRELLISTSSTDWLVKTQAPISLVVTDCAAATKPPIAAAEPGSPSLEDKVVLCVGGRIGNLPKYRQTVERLGAQFCYHDGGIEQNHHQLDANLAAADLVICQTGCISHNSYWRVKDHCKRTGKQCVFVENPSASALALRLAAFSAKFDTCASASAGESAGEATGATSKTSTGGSPESTIGAAKSELHAQPAIAARL